MFVVLYYDIGFGGIAQSFSGFVGSCVCLWFVFDTERDI